MENQVWQCMRCESYNPVGTVKCSVCGEMRSNAAVRFPSYRPDGQQLPGDAPTLSVSDALTAPADDDPPPVTDDRFSADDTISQIRPAVNPAASEPFVPDASGIEEDPFVSDAVIAQIVPGVFQPRPEDVPPVQNVQPVRVNTEQIQPPSDLPPQQLGYPEPEKPQKRHVILPVILTVLSGLAIAGVILYAGKFFDSGDSADSSAPQPASSLSEQVTEPPHTTTLPQTTVPDDGRVTVPNLIGQDYSFAVSALERLGLKPEKVYVESDERKYTIVQQSISAGTSVPEGTAVRLQISKGQAASQTTTEPPVTTVTETTVATETTAATSAHVQPDNAAARKELYRSWFSKNCSMLDRVVVEDVTHDGAPEMIVVHDEGAGEYTARVYTVKNGDVAKIYETSGGESHAGGFFNLYLYKGESDRNYSLGQEYFRMYQGYGSTGFDAFYLTEEGRTVQVRTVSTDDVHTGGGSTPVTEAEMERYRDLLRGCMVHARTIISFYTESDIVPGEIESDPKVVLGL